MSDRIRGGRPPTTPEIPRPAEEATDAAKPQAPTAEAIDTGQVDTFVRSGKVAPQLESRLQALAGKTTAGKIQFSNEDIAYLATTFAAIVLQNPGANRLKRARLFAKAILKRRRLRKVFAGVPDEQMEQMCDDIGEVLDSSPVFGQLVDNVTEGANKLNG